MLNDTGNAYQNKRERVVSFGFDDASYWFSLPIENREKFALEHLLVFEPTWLDDVRVVLIHPDGSRQSFRGGDTVDFEQRSVPNRKINFSFSLPPGRTLLLVRVQTRDPFLVGMTLWKRSAFYEADAHESTYFGLINGALGSLLIFNFIVYLSARDKTFLAYSTYLLAFVIVHSVYNGFAFPLFLRDRPELSNWAHSIFIYLFAFAGLIFSSTFLELKSRMANAYRWANALAILIVISFVLTAVLGGYKWHVRTSILWVVIYSGFALTLERFAGDGMMIFFNDPVLIPDPEDRAARMAIDMQRRFKTLQQAWRSRNYTLSMGIGIAQGEATIGAIGFEGRRDYGAIGSVTNLAARLCSEARPGQILASNKAVRNLKSDIETHCLGGLTLKGFADTVDCHEIVYQEAQLPTVNCDQLGAAPA